MKVPLFRRRQRPSAHELPTKLDVEVREEIRFYLEMRTRELMETGRSSDEAWRAALEAFGEPDAIAEECVAMNLRKTSRATIGVLLHGIGQDVRYALRSLYRTPGFSIVAVLTLAIGIGANTAIFSVVSGVLLQPLPFDAPEELVAIHTRWTPESGYDWPQYPVGSPEYFDYVSQNNTMEHIAAISTEALTVTAGIGDPEIATGALVSSSMFSVLRTPPLLGRTLVESDDGAIPRRVVVLGYDLWQRRFGGDSSVIGQTLDLGLDPGQYGTGGEVVGVMPEGFTFPAPDVQLWTQLPLDPERTWRGGHWFWILGRLAPGVSFADAETEMETIMGGWEVEYPDHHVGHFLYPTPLLDDLVGNVRPALLLVFGAVGFVLLVACANVANLLLARGEGRRREIAVRRALGAGRGRLAQHLLIESVLLAAAGGVLAVLLSHVGTRALLALEGGTIPRVEMIGVDWRVMVFVGVVVLITSLLFGMVPALRAASPNLSDAFKDASGTATGGPRRQHFRRLLTVSEIAVAVLLVTGAGLVAKSFQTLLRQDPGFETAGLLYTHLSLPAARYSPEEAAIFYSRLTDAARELRGVRSVSLVDRPPLLQSRARTRFHMPEDEESLDGAGHTASSITAGAGLFETFGIPLRQGRLLNAADRVGTEYVVVVDEAMARRYWPGEDAIGKQIRFARTDGPFHRVVGVVGNAKFDELGAENPTFYHPYEHLADWMGFHALSMTLVVRAEANPLVNAQPIRAIVQRLDPDLPIVWMRTQDDIVARSVARPRFMMTLLGVFAGVALVLAAVGVYGVMSHGVAQRTGEVGIRVALGAASRDVVRLVVRQGMGLALVGVGIGLAAAFAATRVLTGFLFEVSPTDPWTFGGVSLVVAAVALLACYVPARRASRVDPIVALRTE
jgi:putative ABC transport system permease protein